MPFKIYKQASRRVRNIVFSIGFIDRATYRKSLQKLEDRKRMEEGLMGVIANAYGFEGWGLYRSIKPQQEGQEVAELARIVKDKQPKSVLEIGTDDGGTMYIWCRYLDSVKKIYSVDIGKNLREREKYLRSLMIVKK